MSQASLLNSKAECNNSRIPRIIIEEGEQQREDKQGNKAERTVESRERQVKRKQTGEKTTIEPAADRVQNKKRKIIEEGELTGGKGEKVSKKKSRMSDIHQTAIRIAKERKRMTEKVDRKGPVKRSVKWLR